MTRLGAGTLVVAIAAAGALAGCTSQGVEPMAPIASSPSASRSASPKPTSNHAHAPVPGAFNSVVTQATIDQTICVAGWTKTVRPPVSYTSRLKRQQLAAFGYADQQPRHYEEDHLVPLALGGAPRDPLNLWPEPWSAAKLKDVDEVRLQRAVCAGDETLAQARREILRRWGPQR